MNILEFYTSVLKSVEIVDTDGEGMLSGYYNGDYNPVTVMGGKRLVLPTQEILRAGSWEKRVAFHPLSEKITRTESPVLKTLKDAISLRTDTILITLADALMHAAASPAMHKKMGGPKATGYLVKLPEVKEKTYNTLKRILAATKQPQYRLVNYYLKHGSKGEDGAARTCVVTFPIFDDLEEDGPGTVFGVKVDGKEKKNLLALFEYIFGDAEERKMYSYGSNNPEAPYFHALLTSWYKMATRINVLLDRHKKHVENVEAMTVGLEWAEALDSFALYRGMIPSLEGNEGSIETPVAVEGNLPDLKERAQRTFNRPTPAETASRETMPWEDDKPSSRRPEPEAPKRREEQSSHGGAIGLEEFRAQFERNREESVGDSWGARQQRDRKRGFADGFRDARDDSGRDNPRGRDRDRDRSGFSRRGGGRHI